MVEGGNFSGGLGITSDEWLSLAKTPIWGRMSNSKGNDIKLRMNGHSQLWTPISCQNSNSRQND